MALISVYLYLSTLDSRAESTWVHGPANPLDAELVFPPDHARLFYYLDPACLLWGAYLVTKLRL